MIGVGCKFLFHIAPRVSTSMEAIFDKIFIEVDSPCVMNTSAVVAQCL